MTSDEAYAPFEKDKDANKQLTVKMLKEMLKYLPEDYEVKYDGACGTIRKGDFLVIPSSKEISING